MAVQIPRPSPPPLNTEHASFKLAAYAGNHSLRRRRASNSLVLCCQLSDHQTASQVAIPLKTSRTNWSLLSVSEACSDEELWAAACLRVRTFYDFNEQTFGIEDHKRFLSEREFEALKERVSGKREGFTRVSCINATIPVSFVLNMSPDLCVSCKFSLNGEDRVVVGTLDLNQCFTLPGEIVGIKPKGTEAYIRRAYISHVCVAEELHRNGVGHKLIAKSKIVAEDWGISDLYVHVAVDNEPAKKLYMKSKFTLESDEPAWQARFLDRPRRLLLWTGLPSS